MITRDALGRVLCCHGRPFSCNECGEEYAQQLAASDEPQREGGTIPLVSLPDAAPTYDDLLDLMNAGRWQEATMLMVRKVDALYKAAAVPTEPDALRAALALFAPGSHDGLWGRIKAFIVEGAPTRTEGIAIARQITEWQCAVDDALAAAAASPEGQEGKR